MSYDSIRYGNNRVAAVVIEIDLDRNDATYDSEFLLDTASYGTPKTTDDTRAYLEGSIITHRWANCDIPGIDALPLISNYNDVKTYPAKAKPGESIADTARFTATLSDRITDDNYDIPEAYRDGRQVTGSYFAKLVERNYLKARPIRVKRGYIDGQDFFYQTEHYIVDNWNGPGLDGRFTIEGRDILSLTTNVKAKSPAVSTGVLAVAINDSTTSITFSSSDYGAVSATGYWSIGSEIMSYTIDSSTTATVVRAQGGTTAKSHSVNASIQKCDAYVDENIVDIFVDQLNKTEIPTSYQDTAEYNALKAGEFSGYNLTNFIFKPTEIKKTLNELIKIAGWTVYTDVVEQKIKVIGSSLLDDPVITLNSEEHYIMQTLKRRYAFGNKITRQLIRWAPTDYTSNEDNNYTKNFRGVDLLQEDAARDNGVSEGKDLQFKWLANTTDNNQIAINSVQRNVQRFSVLPEEYEFEVDSAYVGDLEGGGRLWTGAIFAMEIPLLMSNPNGQTKTVILQCTSVAAASAPDRYKITGLAYSANVVSNADYTITAGSYTDYDLATEMAAVISDKGAHDYVVLISNGAEFGASSTSNYSFDTGTFPSGSTLTLINQGQIIGPGGAGGMGGYITVATGCTPIDGSDGSPGGDAMILRLDTTIDNSLGLIGGGGGGGAGAIGVCSANRDGDGGGGGQGIIGGIGGIRGIGDGTAASNGEAGTKNAPGRGGSSDASSAGDGGGLGEDGADSNIGSRLGGAAGKAIELNGFTVTITAGNNAAQIKGAVS